MLLLIIRTIILYFLTLFALKMMGKREIGELQPFELVVILIISEMASIAMQSSNIPILNSIIPIITITLLQITITMINLKNERFRRIVCGKPSIIIENGKIDQLEMIRMRMNINDLLEEMRCQGFFSINDIQFAVLENNGSFNIIPKVAVRPLQVKDMGLDLPEEAPAEVIILDGVVKPDALEKAGLDQKWLFQQLKDNSINRPEDLFIAGVDSNKKFFFQKKDPLLKTKNKKGSKK